MRASKSQPTGPRPRTGARSSMLPLRYQELLVVATLCLVFLCLVGSDRMARAAYRSDDIQFASDEYWPAITWLAGEVDETPARTNQRRRQAEQGVILAQSLQPPTGPAIPSGAQLPAPTDPAVPADAVSQPPVPVDSGTNAKQVGPAAESATKTDDDGGRPKTEEKAKTDDAAKKKDEKPAVPDLAKAILIGTNDGDLTFKPGIRIQPRYMFDSGNSNNDFLIRRFRLKGSGSAYGVAKYGVELKIDNENRFEVIPNARAENAWLEFPVVEDSAYFRFGLYDVPFSRDSLTSDANLLFMDRTLIKEAVTGVGMADNTFGGMLHGRPGGGRFEYAFGIFDDDVFERFGIPGTRESRELMPAGRVVWNLLDPMTPPDGYADYMESYLGKGERLEIGLNAAHLGDAHDGLTVSDITAWGVDLFANSGHYSFQTEYDQIVDNIAAAPDLVADGWYAQFGYLFNPCDPCAEFAVRYEQLTPLIGESLEWTRVGFNFYIRDHNLKVQTDYCFRNGGAPIVPLPGGLGFFNEDVFEVQLQLAF